MAFQIDGVSALQLKFDELKEVFTGGDMKDVYMDAAALFLAEFQRTAPVGDPKVDPHSGNFRRSGYITRGSPQYPNVLFEIDRRIAPYAHFVEYGTSRERPHATIRTLVATMGGTVAEVIGPGAAEKLSKITG